MCNADNNTSFLSFFKPQLISVKTDEEEEEEASFPCPCRGRLEGGEFSLFVGFISFENDFLGFVPLYGWEEGRRM